MSLISRVKDMFKKYSPIKVIPEGYSFPVSENFDFAYSYTMDNEGGLSNEEFDSGGVTKYGVILDDLIQLGFKNATSQNIKDLSKDDARYVFRKLYWEKLDLDRIKNKGVACALCDIGFVRGVGVPPKYCNQLYGTSDLSIINSADPNEFLDKFKKLCDLGFNQIVEKNITQRKFLNGWLNRSNRLLSLKNL